MTKSPSTKKKKRPTKKDIYEKHRARLIEENGQPPHVAAVLAKRLADEERPTLKTRARRRAKMEVLKNGPPEPALSSGLRFDLLNSSDGSPSAGRTAKQPDGTFTALVMIAGKLHKVMTLPDASTAERVARVARAAAWILFKRGERPGLDDLAATAAVSANYQIGMKRRQGRNAASWVKDRAVENLVTVTSQDIVNRVATIVGVDAPKLPEPISATGRPPVTVLTDEMWNMPPRLSTKGIIAAQVASYKKAVVDAYHEVGLPVPLEEIEEVARDFAKAMARAADVSQFDTALEQHQRAADAEDRRRMKEAERRKLRRLARQRR